MSEHSPGRWTPEGGVELAGCLGADPAPLEPCARVLLLAPAPRTEERPARLPARGDAVLGHAVGRAAGVIASAGALEHERRRVADRRTRRSARSGS